MPRQTRRARARRPSCRRCPLRDRQLARFRLVGADAPASFSLWVGAACGRACGRRGWIRMASRARRIPPPTPRPLCCPLVQRILGRSSPPPSILPASSPPPPIFWVQRHRRRVRKVQMSELELAPPAPILPLDGPRTRPTVRAGCARRAVRVLRPRASKASSALVRRACTQGGLFDIPQRLCIPCATH